MSDRLRIVDIPEDGRAPVLVKNIADDVSFFTDQLNLGSPGSKPILATPGGRWGGSRVVGETHDNVMHTWRCRVIGTSTTDCINKIEALLQATDAVWPGRYVEYRAEKATYSTYFELRGPVTWTPQYVYAELAGAASMVIELQAPCAPLAVGDRMDIWDDFSPRGNVLYTNLLVNPSLEVDMSKWTTFGSAGIVATRTTGAANVGGFGLNVACTSIANGGAVYVDATNNNTLDMIPVTAGDKYAASMMLRLASGTLGGSGYITFRFRWHSAAGSYITEDTTIEATGTWTNPGNVWTRLYGTVVVPSGAAYMDVSVVAVNNSGSAQTFTIHADAAMAVKITSTSSTVPVYFDGDTNRGNWIGTAHASISQFYDAGPLDDWVVTTSSSPRAASGQLNVLGDIGNETWMTHQARGYQYGDVQVTVRVDPGASISSSSFTRIILRHQSPTRYLWVGVTHITGAGAAGINIFKNDNGDTSLAGGGSFTITPNTPFWLRARVEGSQVIGEVFTSEPTPGATPTTSFSYTMTSAEAARFVTGYTGLRINAGSGNGDVRWDDFRVEPYTYAARNLPDEFDLASIPGDAPALCDIVLDKAASAVQSLFGCFGWNRSPVPFNYVYNGDFEVNTTGWFTTSAVSALNSGATATRVTSSSKFGSAALQITTDAIATNFEGAEYRLYRRFKKGVTYTLSLWANVTSGTTWNLGGGRDDVGGDRATDTLLSGATWTRYTTTWTPTADRDYAALWVRRATGVASAQTVLIDGVQVYEGTSAPSRGRHAEGQGADPPLGVLEAENGYGPTGTVTANANDRGGNNITQAFTGAQGFDVGSWFIDPSLLCSDDFSEDVSIEFWARVLIPTTFVSPIVRLSAFPTPIGVRARYTNEYGSLGKSLPVPSSSIYQIVRLGTITFPASDLRLSARWQLLFRISTAGGTTGSAQLDYVFGVPANRRVASASGKAASYNVGPIPEYPEFFVSSVAERKRVRYDGAGFSSDGLRGEFPSAAVGGSMIELPPGNARLAALLSGYMIPDDPSPGSLSETDGTSANKPVGIHFSVQPRYRLGRGS